MVIIEDLFVLPSMIILRRVEEIIRHYADSMRKVLIGVIVLIQSRNIQEERIGTNLKGCQGSRLETAFPKSLNYEISV